MHLIAPLAVGIRGARNGTVFAYNRGTDVPAPVWADASGKIRRHGALRLDALGQISLYVDRLVDLVVYDSTMLVVRAWTDGRSAGAVVVEHPAFTGVDYKTGVSGVGERTTLVEALGRWIVSAGAVDWNVLVGTAAQPVSDAIGNVTNVFFDPRSFGAAGDGVADDWGPVQAAIDTANSAGGGIVYLGAGTFNVSSDLSLHDRVSLMGAGAGCTSITVTGVGAGAISMFGKLESGSSSGVQEHSIAGIKFSSSVSSSAPLISSFAGNVAIENCEFDGANNTGPLVDVSELQGFRVTNSKFTVASPSSVAVIARGGGLPLYRRLHVFSCQFVALGDRSSSPLVGLVEGYGLHVDGCMFNLSGVTAGEAICMVQNGDIVATFDGCEMIPSATATSRLFAIGTINLAGERLFEDCSVSDNTALLVMHSLGEGNGSENYFARLRSVECRHAPNQVSTVAANSGAVHTVGDLTQYGTSQYGVHQLTSTSVVVGGGDSRIVVNGIGSLTTYSANIELGREVDFLFVCGVAEVFLASIFRDSVLPDFSLAGPTIVIGFKLVHMRSFAQSPSVGEMNRLMCFGAGSATGGTTHIGYPG